MTSIIEQIRNRCRDSRERTGETPDAVYLGHLNWMEMCMEKDFVRLVRSSYDRETKTWEYHFDGVPLYEVTTDGRHFSVVHIA